MGPSSDLLPVGQRLAQYRQLAEEALQRARLTADRETRTSLLSLAAGWNFLADELEKSRSGTGLESAQSTDRPVQH